MVRYEEATDPYAASEERDATRRWLLDYNRGDVEATLRIRDWLDTEGADFPAVPI
jgi:predicted RecB family nuclease